MVQQTNSFDTYEAIGNREQLLNQIYDVTPTETPVLNSIEGGTVEGTHFEWQTDVLAAADPNNATVEGNIYTLSAIVPTTRVGNYTQIFSKTFSVTGTQQVVQKAGRANEVEYQSNRKVIELKLDTEARICGNFGSVVGSAVVARQTAGLQAWLTTNVSRGVGGANGGFSAGTVAPAINGTLRPFTEALLKSVIQLCWQNSGKTPTMALMGGTLKQTAAGFAGNASRYKNADDRAIAAGADIYESDFGQLMLVPSVFTDNRSCLLVNKDYASMQYLTDRKVVRDELAKVADSIDYGIVSEGGLRVDNEKAHGVIADITA